jgi:hypothetical protein
LTPPPKEKFIGILIVYNIRNKIYNISPIGTFSTTVKKLNPKALTAVSALYAKYLISSPITSIYAPPPGFTYVFFENVK